MSGAKKHNKLAMLLNDSAALLPAVRMSCSKVSAISLVPGDLGGDVFALLVVQGGCSFIATSFGVLGCFSGRTGDELKPEPPEVLWQLGTATGLSRRKEQRLLRNLRQKTLRQAGNEMGPTSGRAITIHM